MVMRITKVYTRTGDAGTTRLAGSQQVWKDSLRVDAYGTVDELNASIGLVRVMNAEMGAMYTEAEQLEDDLRWIQNKLFDIGGGGKGDILLFSLPPGASTRIEASFQAQPFGGPDAQGRHIPNGLPRLTEAQARNCSSSTALRSTEK
jgi:hypothetical protein